MNIFLFSLFLSLVLSQNKGRNQFIDEYPSCGRTTYLSWKTQVSSTIKSTPLITDFYDSDRKDIIIPTSLRYLEIIDGEEGEEVEGWPFSHPHLISQSSTLLYDIDQDGEMEILYFTFNGEVLFFKQDGTLLRDETFKVFPLRVDKDWYVGINEENVDIEMDLSKKPFSSRKPLEFKGSASEEYGEMIQGTEAQGWFSDEAKASMDLIYFPSVDDIYEDEEMSTLYPDDYSRALQSYKEKKVKLNDILVDAHILSTPVICDLDNNGFASDLVIPVSYFYSSEFYSHAEHMKKIPIGIDLSKYVAGGLVVYDLLKKEVKWKVHLDMTTMKHTHKAFIYSSPTIVDFDSNGSLDILIANSLGNIFAIRKDGKVHDGFPIIMKEIQGQVIAEDLNSNGFIEICAMDIDSTLTCFTSDTKVLWSTDLSKYSPHHYQQQQQQQQKEGEEKKEMILLGNEHGSLVGDMNHDGILDIVVASYDGSIFVVSGKDGSMVEPFPLHFKDPSQQIRAPLSFVDVKNYVSYHDRHNGEYDLSQVLFSDEEKKTIGPNTEPKDPSLREYSRKSTRLNILIPSYNGQIYLFDPDRQCVDMMDIGEETVSRVLVDDITGDGNLDYLATSTNGEVTCLSTDIPYHPLKAVISDATYEKGAFTYPLSNLGIFVTKESRRKRDIIGKSFNLEFTIVDSRDLKPGTYNRYKVQFLIGREVLAALDYEKPGTYTVALETPKQRLSGAALQIIMKNEHGQVFKDEISLSFNRGFLRVIKWSVVGPFVLALVFIYVMKEIRKSLLLEKVLPN